MSDLFLIKTRIIIENISWSYYSKIICYYDTFDSRMTWSFFSPFNAFLDSNYLNIFLDLCMKSKDYVSKQRLFVVLNS